VSEINVSAETSIKSMGIKTEIQNSWMSQMSRKKAVGGGKSSLIVSSHLMRLMKKVLIVDS